jgi:hypothetical protein
MFNFQNGNAKQLKKRERVVREIWETEVGYVHDLEVVQKATLSHLLNC